MSTPGNDTKRVSQGIRALFSNARARWLRSQGRTERTFPTPPGLWDIVDRWADTQGMKAVERSMSSREYVKKERFPYVRAFRIHARIAEQAPNASVQGWISLGLLGPWFRVERHLETRAFDVDLARATVNFLLARLGQPRIPEPMP